MNKRELIEALEEFEDDDEIRIHTAGRFDMHILSIYIDDMGFLSIDAGDDGE